MIELSIDFWMKNDPKCPGCGKFHERKRIGNTATFVVKDACNWHGKGKAIPIETPSKPRPNEE